MPQDCLEHRAQHQVVHVALVVIDVAAGQRCLGQMPDQHLVPPLQPVEAVGMQLDEGCVPDAFQEVAALDDGHTAILADSW
jgi:hypothetical protein